MSTRTDVTEVLSQAQWADDGSYLGEVMKSSKFPILVKVCRGQYQNVGQGSFPHSSTVSYLILYSAGKQVSIAAQCVKFKNLKVTPFGPTLSIPQNYSGHFEILSEDGKSVPVISTVETLLQKFPDSCLVRESIKAYRPSDGSGDGHGGISEKSRVVPSGEVLVLVGEVSVPCGRTKVTRYLRCFDSNGQTVYLSLSQKGKFSPVARHDSISGVHTTKNILKKRMPMMVRVVEGKPPLTSATKSTFKFVPELRLLCTLEEELIFAMPLSSSTSAKDLGLIPLPLSVPLKFQVCRNLEEVDKSKEFCRLIETLKKMVDETKNFIQIYDINLKKELRFDGRQWKAYTPPIYLSSATPLLSTTDTSTPPDSSHNYDLPDVQDYEDIDEIYDYVRGVKPQPVTITGTTTLITVNLTNDMECPKPLASLAPEPPPIETIPTHKVNVSGRHVTMVMTGNHHYHAPLHQLGSNGSSPNNTSSTSAGSGDDLQDLRRVKRKHLFVKKRAGSQNNLLDGVMECHPISGSPSNRIFLRKSPIFDFRYKSMNDLNRSSLESRASSGQGQGHSNVMRSFQSKPSGSGCSQPYQNQHRLSSGNLLTTHAHNGFNPLRPSSRGIFRPKSLTNLLPMTGDDRDHPLSPFDLFQKMKRKPLPLVGGKLYL